MENPKFTVFIGKDGQFYFRLAARNGEPILASEGYTNKSGCVNGINSVKKNAVKDEHFKRLIASDGGFYFNLVAENNEVIGKSETYKTQQGGENGIDAVKTIAPNAPIEDTTITPEIKVFENVKSNASYTPITNTAVTPEPTVIEDVKTTAPKAPVKDPVVTPQPKGIDGSIRFLLVLIVFILMVILTLNVVQVIQHIWG